MEKNFFNQGQHDHDNDRDHGKTRNILQESTVAESCEPVKYGLTQSIKNLCEFSEKLMKASFFSVLFSLESREDVIFSLVKAINAEKRQLKKNGATKQAERLRKISTIIHNEGLNFSDSTILNAVRVCRAKVENAEKAEKEKQQKELLIKQAEILMEKYNLSENIVLSMIKDGVKF